MALTPRQQTVVALIAEGLTNRQIAARLSLSVGTIQNVVKDAATRLDNPRNLPAKTLLIHYALKHPTPAPAVGP